MRRHLDDKTVSAFIDGELDPAAMIEVDKLMDSDQQAKDYTLKCVRKTALLKSSLNSVLNEEVPDKLVNSIHRFPAGGERRRNITSHIYRLAAAVLLVLVGYGSALWVRNGAGANGSFEIAPVLDRYGHVLDAALENNLSGIPGKWEEPRGSMVITVTPVRTFRDAGSQYYREYRLQIASSEGNRDVGGLAYRTTGGKWKTKMLYF